jgi:hypothetical protein
VVFQADQADLWLVELRLDSSFTDLAQAFAGFFTSEICRLALKAGETHSFACKGQCLECCFSPQDTLPVEKVRFT